MRQRSRLGLFPELTYAIAAIIVTLVLWIILSLPLKVSASSIQQTQSVLYNNHLLFTGSAPAPSTCGSSPSMGTGSVDNAGTVVVGSGSVTACTLTFATSFTNAPSCVADTDTALAFAYVSAVSGSAVTFTLAASVGSGHIYYHCF